MKLRHRIPSAAFSGSESVTPEYQAQVDRSTTKAQVAYERAQRNLAAALRRQERADEALLANGAKGRKKDTALVRAAKVAAELVELRREELQELDRLMKAAPASSTHRSGRQGHRPVPAQGSIV